MSAWLEFARRIALCVTLVAAAGSANAAGVALTSQKVQWPQDDQEFAGPGADVVNGACLACHSAEMVFAQPKLPAATWTAEVNKMRKVFRAPITDEDVGAIVNYLVKLQTGGT